MKNYTLYSFFFLLIATSALSQTVLDFSDLSGSATQQFNSVAADDGIIYFINEIPANKLVKIDWTGKVMEELLLPFTDSLYYGGQLLREGDQFYLLGVRRLFPNNTGTNNSEIWNSQVRSIIQFDTDLVINKIYTFNAVPFGAGEVLISSGTYAGTQYPTSVSIKNNQIRAIWSYALFDTQSQVPSIIGRLAQYEEIDLTNEEIYVKKLPDVQLILDAVFLEDYFYLYGDVSDTIVNGIPLNSKPIARYDNQGQKLELYTFDDFSSGGFSDGSLGAFYNGKIYSAYFGRSVDEAGCVEDNTVVEIRDTLFNLIKRVKLPDCDLFPYGKNSFAFTSNGDFYFNAIKNGGIHLYRFDPELKVICSQAIAVAEELPISLKVTPDDKLILENILSQSEMKLYQFSCGNISSTKNVGRNTQSELSFYPNPTSGSIYLDDQAEEISINVYSLSGELLLRQNARDKSFDLSALNPGLYLIEAIDRKTRIPVSMTKLMKH